MSRLILLVITFVGLPLFAQPVTFVAPKSGSVFSAHTQLNYISIIDEGDIAYPVVLEYTTDGGDSWTLIVEMNSWPLSGYAWYMIPNVDADAQLKITDSQGAVSLSAVFRIQSRTKATYFEINSGERPVRADQDVWIEWSLNHDGGPIELLQTQGVGFVPIAALDPSTRHFIWHTPSFALDSLWLRLTSPMGLDTTIGPITIREVSAVRSQFELPFLVSPNPAAATVTLASVPENSKRISIVDLSGATVLALTKQSNKIDVSALPSGSYRVIIETDNDVINRPLIISR